MPECYPTNILKSRLEISSRVVSAVCTCQLAIRTVSFDTAIATFRSALLSVTITTTSKFISSSRVRCGLHVDLIYISDASHCKCGYGLDCCFDSIHLISESRLIDRPPPFTMDSRTHPICQVCVLFTLITMCASFLGDTAC